MDHRLNDDLGTMEVLREKPCPSDSKRTVPRSNTAFRGDSTCSKDVILRDILRRVRKIAKKATIRIVMSACQSAWNNSAPTDGFS